MNREFHPITSANSARVSPNSAPLSAIIRFGPACHAAHRPRSLILLPLCFHGLTNCFCRNSFIIKPIQVAPRVWGSAMAMGRATSLNALECAVITKLSKVDSYA